MTQKTPSSSTASAQYRPHGPIGIVGMGRMGRALANGLLASGCANARSLWGATRTPKSAAAVEETTGIRVRTTYDDLLPDTATVFLCVKPHHVEQALGAIARSGLSPHTLMVSTVTGVATHRLEAILGTGNPWVRAMPNTPCLVREGATVICPGALASNSHVDRVKSLLSAMGLCLCLDESLFDAATAINGCGPAYAYLMIEALADAGVHMGLPRDVALKLVTQTMLGAARMVQETGQHPAVLRDEVATPAGCTIAGIMALEDGRIRSVLARAVEDATRVAHRLGAPQHSTWKEA